MRHRRRNNHGTTCTCFSHSTSTYKQCVKRMGAQPPAMMARQKGRIPEWPQQTPSLPDMACKQTCHHGPLVKFGSFHGPSCWGLIRRATAMVAQLSAFGAESTVHQTLASPSMQGSLIRMATSTCVDEKDLVEKGLMLVLNSSFTPQSSKASSLTFCWCYLQ